MFKEKALEQIFNASKSCANPMIAQMACVRQMLTEDFFLFCKFGLGYKDIEWDVHREPIKVCESHATRKIIIEPRGTFKSSIGSVAYPIWRLIKNPNITILLDSELYTNSKNFLREIKGHLESERLAKIFGDHVGEKWDEGEIIVKTRSAIRKEATITVGGIGTVKVGQHYDLIIGDDYNSQLNSDSPEKCQKVIDHVRYNMNILNPGGEYLFIATRYAERDIPGFLLSDVLGEKHLAEGVIKLFDGVVNREDEVIGF